MYTLSLTLSPMAWGALALLVGWLVFVPMFVTVMKGKDLKKRGYVLHWFFAIPVYLCAIIGWPIDVIVYNFVIGTWVFREIPHELVFTDRVKRHLKGAHIRRRRKAEWWAEHGNRWAPGHF